MMGVYSARITLNKKYYLRFPKVSVIIPVYNGENWIKETIRSVGRQDYPKNKIEVIIIDDGSTDSSYKVALKESKKHLKNFVVHRQENRGVSAARNEGLKNASGKWVQFLDADDKLHPLKIRHQIMSLKNNIKAEVVYSPWASLVLGTNNQWSNNEIRRPVINNKDISTLIEDSNFIATGSQLISKKALLKIGGYDEKRSMIEDTQLHIRLHKAGCRFIFANYKEPLLLYRKHSINSSRNSKQIYLHGIYSNLKELGIQLSNNTPLLVKKRIVKVYEQILRGIRLSNPTLFNTAFRELMQINPTWSPNRRPSFKILTKIIGYPNAELFACILHKALERLNTKKNERTKTN